MVAESASPVVESRKSVTQSRATSRHGRTLFESLQVGNQAFQGERHSADTAGLRHEKYMNQEPNSEAAETVQTTSVPAVDLPRLVLPFELALTRWSLVCIIWRDLASDHPNLTAFLAGWGCRCIGAAMPETIESFRDSFRVGWREADTMIAIEIQRQNAEVRHGAKDADLD